MHDIPSDAGEWRGADGRALVAAEPNAIAQAQRQPSIGDRYAPQDEGADLRSPCVSIFTWSSSASG